MSEKHLNILEQQTFDQQAGVAVVGGRGHLVGEQ